MYVDKHCYDDIVKYFHKTYVKFKEDVDVIYLIKQVTHSDIIAEDSKGNEVAICLNTGYNIDYVIPKKTVFQHGEHALFLARVPARMWRKGMDHKNTEFSILSAAGNWSKIPFNIQHIEGFVNKPSYFTYLEALNNFQQGEALQSAALSPRISLTRKGAVFVDMVMVGKMDFEKNVLACKTIFSPELVRVFGKAEVKVKLL